MSEKETITAIIKEIQEYVKKHFDQSFKEPLKKEWIGSNPVSAFDEKGLFTEKNWNDARVNLFRAFFSGFFHPGIHNQIVFIGDLEVAHFWCDDQNYVFIRNTQTNDLYYATWYKSRGRTDLILHNGRKITLTEFKKLLLEMLKPVREG